MRAGCCMDDSLATDSSTGAETVGTEDGEISGFGTTTAEDMDIEYRRELMHLYKVVPKPRTPWLPVSPLVWNRISRWYNNGCPAVLLQLLCLYLAHSSLQYGDFMMVEFFAGCESMTSAFRFFDYMAYGFEIRHDALLEDLLSQYGFIVAATLLWRLHPSGIVLFAPVCSSWVFMSRHKTGRSFSHPLGMEDRYYKVKASNIMVSRVVLQCLYCISRGILFVVEQPCNSILSLHPRFQHMLKHHLVYQYDFDMIRLGSQTKKPTKFQFLLTLN